MALLLPSPEASHFAVVHQRHQRRHRRRSSFEAPTRNVTNLRVVQRISILRSGSENGSRRVRVWANVKDLEEERAVVEELGDASPLKQRSKEEEEEEEKRNYYVNSGYAIRTLREEFPALFYKQLKFDIYRDDIVFKDPVNTFVGIDYYKSIFWALRFHGRLFFRALWIDIISVWQPVESTIMVRWTVHGIPRVPWESRARFDGTSEYKLDKTGKIYEHQVHNIALNSPPRFHAIAVHELVQVIGCSSMPKPTYFEILPSFIEQWQQ